MRPPPVRSLLVRSLPVRSLPVRSLTVRVALLVLTAALVLVGCTSSKTKSSGPTATAAPTTAAKSTLPPLVQHTLPSSLANNPKLRTAVIQTKCAKIAGGWSAEGTAKNAGTKTLTFKIVVYFTTPQATALDYAVGTVKVAPGQTGKWVAAKKFLAQPQMLCPMPGISAS